MKFVQVIRIFYGLLIYVISITNSIALGKNSQSDSDNFHRFSNASCGIDTTKLPISDKRDSVSVYSNCKFEKLFDRNNLMLDELVCEVVREAITRRCHETNAGVELIQLITTGLDTKSCDKLISVAQETSVRIKEKWTQKIMNDIANHNELCDEFCSTTNLCLYLLWSFGKLEENGQSVKGNPKSPVVPSLSRSEKILETPKTDNPGKSTGKNDNKVLEGIGVPLNHQKQIPILPEEANNVPKKPDENVYDSLPKEQQDAIKEENNDDKEAPKIEMNVENDKNMETDKKPNIGEIDERERDSVDDKHNPENQNDGKHNAVNQNDDKHNVENQNDDKHKVENSNNPIPNYDRKSASRDKFPSVGDDDAYILQDKYLEANDSHFFTYMTVLSFLGLTFYCVVYHKKKILALIFEGRRSRTKRRPNTAAYSKLDCNLEEALLSGPTSSEPSAFVY